MHETFTKYKFSRDWCFVTFTNFDEYYLKMNVERKMLLWPFQMLLENEFLYFVRSVDVMSSNVSERTQIIEQLNFILKMA